MTHCVPCSAPRGPLPAVLLFGLLAGLAAPDASAAPPAPVAPIITSAATRFTDNGNGTVTDSITGLVWLKDANCDGGKNWSSAMAWVATLKGDNTMCTNTKLNDGSTAGQWRLPNRNELQSLIDYTTSNPALPAGHPFVGVQSGFLESGYYWSSTSYAPDTTTLAWYVTLYDGYVYLYGKPSDNYVWPVRGGQ